MPVPVPGSGRGACCHCRRSAIIELRARLELLELLDSLGLCNTSPARSSLGAGIMALFWWPDGDGHDLGQRCCCSIELFAKNYALLMMIMMSLWPASASASASASRRVACKHEKFPECNTRHKSFVALAARWTPLCVSHNKNAISQYQQSVPVAPSTTLSLSLSLWSVVWLATLA